MKKIRIHELAFGLILLALLVFVAAWSATHKRQKQAPCPCFTNDVVFFDIHGAGRPIGATITYDTNNAPAIHIK
jgi:hypothetical protein